MMMVPLFRYFLGFQVAADRAGWLARQLPPVAGDLFAGLKPQHYHLTLCTIAETAAPHPFLRQRVRSEEHTSELQSLMRISYAVFCLKKKTKKQEPTIIQSHMKSPT